ncbi:MAG: DUF2855 family protein [Deltaproteobacteria bacterium]|nr:DUF2855 family protein [Deltaproteobacteria bacterium]
MADGLDFIVKRTDLRQCELITAPLPPLADGQVRLRVDRFAFTANNVTYGAVADLIGYWNFFPAREGWGRIPVWGFAEVVESRCAALPVGARLFGYLPMSTHLVMQPERVSAEGLVDGSPHRAALPQVYNQYTRVAPDTRQHEAALALFRPLFTTSFLLEDALAEHDDFGATHIVLTSASSKTALCLAFLLARARRGGRRVVGLTSPAKAAFVRRTGYYDDVIAYDALDALQTCGRAACVDFAGNGALLAAVHRALGERLQHTYLVGLTHWEQRSPAADLPGPTPVFFFAPDRVDKRRADWGMAEFQRRVGGAMADFAASATAWLTVVDHSGPQAVERLYQQMVAGEIDPAVGHMATLCVSDER